MFSRAGARLAVILCCAIFAGKARAVVIAGSDGTANTTAPADDFGFANVGMVFNTADGFFNSGVYLGNGWVLSAYHPVRDNAGGFLFGSVIFHDPTASDVTFAVNSGSAVRLKNADDSPTDLALFQLSSQPTFLSPVRLAASTPIGVALMDPSVRMSGFGLNREPNETHWAVTAGPGPNDDVWTETPGAGTRQGFKWGGGQTLRWGDNTLEFNGVPVNRTFPVNGGYGLVTSIKTDFDTIAGHAQGAAGDSGGGVFYKNGANWELLGIMHSTDRFDGQPNNTAVFGNATYAANIPTYRSQILAIIPEPSAGILAWIGIVMLAHRPRRPR